MKWTLLVFVLFCSTLNAQSLKRQTLSSVGVSNFVQAGDKNYYIQQSVGQQGVINSFEFEDVNLRQGFIQPLKAIVLGGNPNDLEIVVYPNPFTEGIVVKLNEDTDEQIQIYLFDVQGRLLFQQDYETTTQLAISLGFLTSGVYFLRMQSGQQKQTVKLIKQ